MEEVLKQNTVIGNDIKEIKQTLLDQRVQIRELEDKVDFLQNENGNLKQKVTVLERKLKKNNIIIFGWAEENKETTIEQFLKLLDNKLGTSVDEHCEGKKQNVQIKNGKLLVNGDEYTVQQLQEEEDGTNGLEDRTGGTSKQLGKRDTENCVITARSFRFIQKLTYLNIRNKRKKRMETYIRDFEILTPKTSVTDEIPHLTELLTTTQTNMKIFHINIRSVSKNLDYLNIFLQQVAYDFDIIVLTECWQIKIYLYLLKTNFTGKNVDITAVYRSPSTCPKTFVNDLYNYLDQTRASTQVVVGDMNIDISNNSDVSNYYLNLISNTSLEQWTEIYTSDTLESAINIFVGKIQTLIQISANKVKLKRSEIKRSPWITNKILKMIEVKSNMYKIMKRKPTAENNQNYKQIKNKVESSIKAAKKQYYEEKINKNGHDSSTLWKVIKNITNSEYKSSSIREIKSLQGDLTTNMQEVVNHFAEFYNSVGEDLANTIKNKQPAMKFNKITTCNSFFLEETNETEIISTILSLKNKKSPGTDGIRAEELKIIAQQIAKPVCYLINRCFREGYVPLAFKLSSVSPIYKGGDKLNLSNYRPISLVSSLSKIFEKTLKNRIVSYLETNNILSVTQFGFTKGKSTQDAIQHVLSKITKYIDENTPCLCTFVDLTKAFDTVDHKLLLDVLGSIGFRGNEFNLMSSYLTGRYQCVKINNTVSSYKLIKYGIPQGTVLGPILFNIYLADLYRQITKGIIISFADDTVVINTANTWKDLKKEAELDISYIKAWFNHRMLTMNLNKTFFIPFSSSIVSQPDYNTLSIELQNDKRLTVNSTENLKYLGLYIDRYLRWDVHITHTIKKVRSILPKVKYIKTSLSIKSLETIYCLLIESHINYAITAWGGANTAHIKLLETTQKIILKTLYNKPSHYPSKDLFNEVKFFDIRQQYFYKVIVSQYQNRNKDNVYVHNYSTRNKNIMEVPKPGKNVMQRSFVFLGPRSYNLIPEELKKINSFALFKKKLKHWIANLPRQKIHQYVDIKNVYYINEVV
nr:unnamed protein product [Callosobruchus analis]